MNRERHRLLIFGTDFPPESVGTAAYAHALATGMQQRGVQVTVLTRDCSVAASEAFDRAQPFSVIRMRRPPDVPQAYLAAWRGLRRALAATRPHCLWTTNGMATRVAGLPGIDRHLPVISSIRGTDIRTRLPGRGPWRRLESIPQRRCYRRSAAIAAASRYLREVAISKGVAGERIFVSFSAVPEQLQQIAEAGPASPTLAEGGATGSSILTVARLTDQKKLNVAIAAMEIVQRRFPGAGYTIVGDGPERPRLEEQARRLGVRVRFAGQVPAMSAGLWQFYRCADLFLLTSSGEGLANVLLEAGAFGLASVGPCSGGVPEALVDGGTGLLADPEDPRQVAGKVMQLLADDGERRRMGDRARLRVRSLFSVDALADRCHPVLESVLAGVPRAVAGSC